MSGHVIVDVTIVTSINIIITLRPHSLPHPDLNYAEVSRVGKAVDTEIVETVQYPVVEDSTHTVLHCVTQSDAEARKAMLRQQYCTSNRKKSNSGMLRPGIRVCNSMRKITEIIKDYGGVAYVCQLTEVWPGCQKTSNEG